MVLTEAFAAGTPVVASDIAGYRDVVHRRRRRRPRPARRRRRRWPRRCATSRWTPSAAQRLGRRAAQHGAALRVAARGRRGPRRLRGRDRDAARPRRRARGAPRRLTPADGRPYVRPRRLPSLEPPPPAGAPHPVLAIARKAALGARRARHPLPRLRRARAHRRRTTSSARSSPPSPRGCSPGSALMCVSMVAARRRVARDPASRAARGRASGSATRCRARSSACSCPRRCRRASASPRVRSSSPAGSGARGSTCRRSLGTIVSQTLLNVFALVVLGAVMFSTVDVFTRHKPLLVRRRRADRGARDRGARAVRARCRDAQRAPGRLRRGGAPRARAGPPRAARRSATRAWAPSPRSRSCRRGSLQWLSCYILLVALGLDDHGRPRRRRRGALRGQRHRRVPATPSNLGVFQAACVAVLGAYGVGAADALAYGIILQAVEIATAVIMGAPALVKEGVSWRDVRLRAMHATPVELPPIHSSNRSILDR